jgi:hypothetical protein
MARLLDRHVADFGEAARKLRSRNGADGHDPDQVTS